MKPRLGGWWSVIPDSIRDGVLFGLFGATVLSALVGVISLVRGSAHWPQYGSTTTWEMIGGYYGAGIVAGVVFGALQPLCRWRLGVFAQGWIGGSVIYASLGFAMGFPVGETLLVAAVLGLGVGGAALVVRDATPRHSFRWSVVGIVMGLAAVVAALMKLAGWW